MSGQPGFPNIIRSGTIASKLNEEFGDMFDELAPGDEIVEPTLDDLKMFAKWKAIDKSGDPTKSIQRYKLSPTFVKLSQTWRKFSVVTGPVGSGKTTMACLMIPIRCCSQMPCADGIVRNKALFARGTYEELKTTTLDVWMHLFPQTRIKLSSPIEGCLQFRNNNEQHILYIDAFGFDASNVENKLRSRAYSIGFFNEVQYMLWLPIETALERFGRYPFADMAPPAARALQREAEAALDKGSTDDIQGYFLNLGGIADTNSPVAGSWLYQRAEVLHPPNELYLRQPPAMFSEGTARTGWRYVRNTGQKPGIPRAENVENLSEGWAYYEDMRYTKSRDVMLRTVCNEYGAAICGDSIFSEFNPSIHIMKADAKPDPSLPWLLGADNGLVHPALLAAQFNRQGQLCVYAECDAFNKTTLQFYRETVIPSLALLGFTVNRPHALWADPAHAQRNVAATADDDLTSLNQILSLGFSANICPVPRNASRVRINTVKDALTRFIDGLPALVIHPSCKKLIAAMSGEYHYKLIRGFIKREDEVSMFREPEKNHASDIADALQYLVCGYFAEGLSSRVYTRAVDIGGIESPALASLNALHGSLPI